MDFNTIWQKIKNRITAWARQTPAFLRQRYSFVLGFIFTWLVPIYLLNEKIILVEEVPAQVKITCAGLLVLLFCFFALRKRIYGKILTFPVSTKRAILKTIHRAVGYGLFLGVFWALSNFSGILFDWWVYSGISMFIGSVFYIIDERMQERRLSEIEVQSNEQ